MGRNLDYPVFIEILTELQTLFLLEPHQGQPLASLAWPGYVGVCTGMNRAGVALAQLSAMSRDRTLQGDPGGPALPAGPGRRGHGGRGGRPRPCRLPGTIGNNLMLCDPREALVLELSARSGAVRRPQDGLAHRHQSLSEPRHAAPERPLPAPPPCSVLSA